MQLINNTGTFLFLLGSDRTGSEEAEAAQLGSYSAIRILNGTVLPANERRAWFAIINLDDAPVLVKLGAGATTSDFNVALQACTTADDGKGGSYFDASYRGIVSIIASTGAPRVSVIEMES